MRVRSLVTTCVLATSLSLGCNLSDPNPYVDVEAERQTSTTPPTPDLGTPEPDASPPVTMDMPDDVPDMPPVGVDMGTEEMGTIDAICGDGQVTGSETCDGDCPVDPATDCGQPNACRVASIEGDAEQCQALCMFEEIEMCADDDGCCPLSCTPLEDNDCNNPRLAAGMPCMMHEDCGDNRVCLASEGGQGMCSATCASDEECLSDEACLQIDGVDASHCVTPCEHRRDCPQNTVCSPGESLVSSELFCIPPWLSASKIGQGCMDGASCGDGEQCITPSNSHPGGYCTATCNPEACPTGATCHAINPASPEETSFCYADCTQDADCRAGYACLDKPEGMICLPGD